MSVIDDLMDYFKRFIAFENEDHPLILSLWTANTWVYEHSSTAPYLYVFSQEKQSGKTLTLDVLQTVARNPLMSNDITSAALFRAIDYMTPTIFLDEVDNIFTGSAGKQELRGMLNSGYKKNGYIYRCDKDSPAGVKAYSTFGPKVFAGIDNACLPDTLASRCIPLKLSRKPKGVEMEEFFAEDVVDDVEPILAQLESLAQDASIIETFKTGRPVNTIGVQSRQWEISRPLVNLAEALGYGEALREALKRVFEKPETNVGESLLESLLGTIHGIFVEREETGDPYPNKLFTEDVLTALQEYGTVWTGKMLSEHLDKIDVHPAPIRRGSHVKRGYLKEQFEEAWAKYTDVAA